jgi:electron transfer flavoprotein alpha subunit
MSMNPFNEIAVGAALLDVMAISDMTAVVDSETFERPIYACNAIHTVKSSGKVNVLSVRTAAFTTAGQGGSAAIGAKTSDLSCWIEDKVSSGHAEVTSARIMVSGVCDVGSKSSFAIIEVLVDKVGDAVGQAVPRWSRAMRRTTRSQAGQPGKVVAPQLYVAAGISGAIQHLAREKDSKIIVAINKGEEALIVRVADYGLVGDLFTVVPDLTGKLS